MAEFDVLADQQGPVLLLTLNRPERLEGLIRSFVEKRPPQFAPWTYKH